MRAAADVLLYSYLPLYLDSHVGETRLWLISLVPATPALLRFIMAPYWGRRADVTGSQRPYVVMGLLAYSMLLLLLPLLASTGSVILLIAGLAIPFSAFNPVVRTWLTLRQPKHGLHRLARWHQWEALGYFVTAGAVGWLAMDDMVSLPEFMRIIAVALAICALLVALYVKDLPVAASKGRVPQQRRLPRRSWIRGKKVLPLGLLAFLLVSSLGWEAVVNMFGLYFTKEVGGPMHLYGAVVSAATLVSAISYGVLANYGQRHGYQTLLKQGAWGYTGMYALMAYPSPWTVGLAYLIPMSTFVRTALNVFITERVAESQRGVAMGTIESLEAGSILVGALAGGLLADRFGLAILPLAALGSTVLLHLFVLRPRRIKR